MKESLQSVDRRCVFRETFTPESIEKNGAELSGVTVSNGIATFDGTGGIKYGKINDFPWGSFTVRMRFRVTTTGINHGLWYKRSGGVSSGIYHSGFVRGTTNKVGANLDDDVLVRQASSTSPVSLDVWTELVVVYDRLGNLSVYLDGAQDGTPVSIISTGSISNDNDFYIGCQVYGSTAFIGDMDLFEIYEGVITPQEITLLNSDNLHKGYVKEGLVLDCDYTSLSTRNKARDYGDNLVVNGGFDSWTGDVPDGWVVISTPPASFVEEVDRGCRVYSSDGTSSIVQQYLSLTVGKTYKLLFDLVSSVGSWEFSVGTSFSRYHSSCSLGTNEIDFIANTTSAALRFKRSSACDFTIDNVSVREVLEETNTDVDLVHGVGAVFNGSSSRLNYGNPDILNFGTDDFTMEFVIDPCEIPATDSVTVYNKGPYSGTVIGTHFLRIHSGSGLGWFYNGRSVMAFPYTQPTKLHIILTRLSGVCNFILNGEVVGSAVDSSSLVSAFPLQVGTYQGNWRYYKGAMQVFRAYKGKGFTLQEVAQNYQYARSRNWV